MYLENREMVLKDGRKVSLRGVTVSDGCAMLAYLKQVSGETHFMIRYPEEVVLTEEQEEKYLESLVAADNRFMLAAFYEGMVAGNISVAPIGEGLKQKHRGGLGIAIVKDFWNAGLGTILLKEAVRISGEVGFHQLELGVFEDNARAIHLYEKNGFEKTGVIPRAFRLKDDTFRDEIQMVLKLKD